MGNTLPTLLGLFLHWSILSGESYHNDFLNFLRILLSYSECMIVSKVCHKSKVKRGTICSESLAYMIIESCYKHFQRKDGLENLPQLLLGRFYHHLPRLALSHPKCSFYSCFSLLGFLQRNGGRTTRLCFAGLKFFINLNNTLLKGVIID